jgi:hypothetical protein
MPDLLAEKAGWALRGAEGGFAAARLEQDSNAHTPSAKIQKAPKRGLSYFGGEGGIRTRGTL